MSDPFAAVPNAPGWRGTAAVWGKPVTQGSKRIGRSAAGRPIILDVKDGALKSWRRGLQLSMLETAPPTPLDAPVRVELHHYQARPLSHYRTNGALKPNAPRVPQSGLDLDKLARAVGDAGSRLWWRDDARIAWWVIRRRWAEDGREVLVVQASEITGESDG